MLLVPSWPDFPAGAAVKNLAALERNVQVKSVNMTKTSKSFPCEDQKLYCTSPSFPGFCVAVCYRCAAMKPCYTLRVMRRTVLSSSLASSSSGSVVTEGILGLYQDICSVRPLNLAPWLAAWKTKTTAPFKSVLAALMYQYKRKKQVRLMRLSHETYILCFTPRLKGHDDAVGVLVTDILNLTKFLRFKWIQKRR